MSVIKKLKYKDTGGVLQEYDIGAEASNVTQDSAHRFATDTEKSAWNGKAEANHTHKIQQTATIVIGTSTAGYTTNDVDYLCDGTDDQVEINSAITALPANGGKIVLLDGAYSISASIDVNKSNVAIEGTGMGSTAINTTVALDAITVSGTKCSLSRFSLAGTVSNSGSGINLSGTYCLVDSVEVSQFYNGINAYSATSENEGNHTIAKIYAHDCYRPIYIKTNSCVVRSCRCLNGTVGIWADGNFNQFADNIVKNMSNNGIGFYKADNSAINNYISDITSAGIYLFNSARHNLSKNRIVNCNYAIALYYASYSNIDGNICYNNETGLSPSYSHHNNVSHNTFMRGTGQTSDYTETQYTIRAGASVNNTMFIDNIITGKNYVDDDGDTSNIWQNNITV